MGTARCSDPVLFCKPPVRAVKKNTSAAPSPQVNQVGQARCDADQIHVQLTTLADVQPLQMERQLFGFERTRNGASELDTVNLHPCKMMLVMMM